MIKTLLKRLSYLIGFTPSGLKSLIQYLMRVRWIDLFVFWREMRNYRKGIKDDVKLMIWPCLDDRKLVTPIDKYYFYQDVWSARIAFAIKPKRIIDIGSTALLTGIFSQFTETVSIDIRPLPVSVDGLTCKQGSIIQLPYPDNSLEYVNSICVIEHLGLGRYGDPVDPLAIEKAAAELRRVIRLGGYLVLSVPVGPPCIVFNAHRVFSRDEFLGMFPEFDVFEEVFCVPEYTETDPTPNMRKGDYHIFCICLQKKTANRERS